MIIDRFGNIIDSFNQEYGTIIHDGDYAVCLMYEKDSDVELKRQVFNLKNQLRTTDYKAIKFAEGQLTEEEYAPFRQQRQEIRDKINEIEPQITELTISREDLDKAEAISANVIKINSIKVKLDSIWNEMQLKMLSSELSDEERGSIENSYRNRTDVVEMVNEFNELTDKNVELRMSIKG